MHLKLVLPSQLAVGVTHETPKLIISADYAYQNWRPQQAL